MKKYLFAKKGELLKSNLVYECLNLLLRPMQINDHESSDFGVSF